MSRKRSKKKSRISNKALTTLACVLAVVCLFAGGIYIDTFHGSGAF
ncbi:MAG: hypothetical protein IKL30_06795 [Anaerotignum sp.]|nr:hypothetical protein [Anaerotignum sp.]